MNARFSKYVTALAIVATVLGVASTAFAQGGLTGQISGTVVDNTKAVLPGVTVTVRNTNTGVTRDAVTDGSGAFVVTNLLAGSYDVKISLTGFKASEQKNLGLLAQQRLALGTIVLEVGGVTETVSVQAKALEVQTTSGERSATITASQIEDIGLRGRDFMGTLKTLPGVVDTSARDAPGWGSVGGMTINGQSSFNFSYDGIVSKDTGSNSGNYAAPGLDSIAEVKVQSSNFQAEYGRSSGASITVTTKSGTNAFRGTAAYYRRNEKYNANTWDRRRSCDAAPVNQFGQANPNCQKAPYRFDNPTYTFGGPVKLPDGKLKNKLFFFWSQDILLRVDPGTLSNSTMPTELERNGDFSQTVRTNGTRIWIKDPQLAAQGLACDPTSGGAGCFAGNIIPSNRINAFGQKMLGIFPLPNATDPTGQRQFNYQIQMPIDKDRNDQVLRVDYNIAQSTNFYTRLQFGHEIGGRGFGGLPAGLGAGGGAWPQMENSYDINTISSVNTLLHTFDPTTVLEVTVGTNWSHQYVYPVNQAALDTNDRTKVLPGLTQFFPSANPMNLVPNMTFAGSNAQPSTRSVTFESRYPFFGYNPITDITSNITKVMGKHNMKAGIFIEHNSRPAARQSTFNGSYDFGSNVNNGFDTNFGFANALIGSINSYSESTTKPNAEGRYNQLEFFIQDNWRVTRNFTLDGGVRFYRIGSTFVDGQQVGYFDQAAWNSAKAPILYEPVCPVGLATCSTTQRLAKNPLTGEIVNNTFVGKLVPGSGDFYNGIQVVDGTPYGAWGIVPAVRGGFAWDVAGNGKTAVRGGFGTFYDRYSDDTILALVQTPPLQDTRSTNFTTIPQLLASQLVQSPAGPSAFATDNFHPPTVYNWSMGVQRELPFKFTADLAYVGNASRHNSATIPLNTPAYGTTRTDLNPAAIDPTNCSAGVCAAKATDYLRPMRGFSGISLRQWTGYANYHSIQLSIQRRLQRGFAFGMSYTGSTRSSYGNTDPLICPIGQFTCTPEQNAAEDKRRNYTAGGSRPHNLVFNYNYQVPRASQHWDNVIVKGVLDGWQISGVTTIQSGTRSGFSYAFTGAPGNLTGGGPQDVVLTCDPKLPKSERTTDRQFRTECITFGGPVNLPGDTYYFGNSTGDEWVNLGYINHDITFFKNFAMTGRKTLRFQIELYNAFNTTQYSAVDTSAQFNYATGVQTDTNFGRITGVRGNSNRVIQLGARFSF